MSTRSMTAWLRGLAARDALISAWRLASERPITTYEIDALTIAARAIKARTPVTVVCPSGRARLPLLAAVHAAALRLPGFPSPLSGRLHGPIAFVTRQTIRRAELADIDAAGVPVSPALHPARLRADGLVAPLPAGRALPQNLSHRLLLVTPSTAWAAPTLPPAVVVIDGGDERSEFMADAVAWASAYGATTIVFTGAARRAWLPGSLVHPCAWSAILAAERTDDDPLAAIAPIRGHAAVHAAGARPDLATVAALLADARRHGPLPPVLIGASALWRRLDELVVPLTTYDAACPRWHSPTLTERLDDLALVRAADFPHGWRTWAETCWAGIKEGMASARTTLSRENTKSALLIEAVDADLRAGLAVDVALPSRISRDALARHLAEVGVPIPVDDRLIARSLADTGTWDPPRVTMLAAPPGIALRHRIVGADIGPLNVLCYDHEVEPLRRILRDALDEPQTLQGPLRRLLPPALDVVVDLPAQRPKVIISAAAAIPPGKSRGSNGLTHLADAIDIAGLSALRASDPGMVEADLPETDQSEEAPNSAEARQGMSRFVAAVPLTVVSAEGGPPVIVHVPAHATLARILDGAVHRLPALDVASGMLVTALDGLTPFDRLRPLLTEARGPVARMLLAAWDQALTTARQRFGESAIALTRALENDGAKVTSSTVTSWSDEDRIGPREAENIIRIGRLANHPIVEHNGSAIADVMRRLRLLHQSIGRMVAANPGMIYGDAAEELDRLLGPDAVSIVHQIVVYRVLAVGMVATVNRNVLSTASPVASKHADYVQEEGAGE